MSTCNENEKSDGTQESISILDVLVEMVKEPSTYKEYAEETVKKVLKELEKGEIYWTVDFDDPLEGAYYTVVQNHTMNEEAKAISRIIKDFNELAEDGLKVENNQQLLLYRLYELSCNEQVDIKSISASDFKTITKYADWIGKVGTIANIVEGLGYAANIVPALFNGDTKGVTDEFANIIGSSSCGYIAAQLAGAMITAFAVSNPLVAFATFAVFGLIGSAIGDEIAEGWKKIFDEIFGFYDNAGAYTYPVDPLIFDLDGDGIETTSVKNGVHFDFDKNGFAEKLGWVGADDGLLVRDLNGNGNIDNGGELFGDLTQIAEGVTAVNGFEALAALDLNGDGVIDSNDAIYSELRIWQDKNQNGTVDEGELFTLEEAGIAGIGLDYDTINETDGQGNSHTQQGYYVKADGSTGTVEDVWFDKEASDTVVVDDSNNTSLLEETEEILGLPDIEGTGNQYSLHQAMLRDTTGTLQSLVEQYVAETDSDLRRDMVTQIIYVWTGVADQDPKGRGSNISDARKLAALEVITGRGFNSAYGTNPVIRRVYI